ncbi:MAG: hypothetical protein V4456_18870 [Bacteroidota bacterium]
MKTKFTLKTIILSLLLMAAGGTAFAQCDKTATFSAATTNYLNDKGVVERTKDEETVVTLNKKSINITTGGNHELTGAVKTYTCNWATPYKTGKTVITTLITDGGRDMNATVTIEGKDGKVTLTFEAIEMPNKKIQLLADKFE